MDDFEQVSGYYEGRPEYPIAFFESIVGALNLGRDSSVLDLACGLGELSYGLSLYTGSVMGVDNSAAMLRMAARKTAPNVAFKHWDLNQAPFDAGKRFDLVTIGRAIHHLDPTMLRGTLLNSLAEEGFVIVCTAGLTKHKTPWLPVVNRLMASFQITADQNVRNFAGVEIMKALSFAPVRNLSGKYAAAYDFDRIVKYCLSYRSAAVGILPRLEEFRRVAKKALAPFQQQDGSFPAALQYTAQVFQFEGRK